MLYHQQRKGTCALCGQKKWKKDLTVTVEQSRAITICYPCAGKLFTLLDPGQESKKGGANHAH